MRRHILAVRRSDGCLSHRGNPRGEESPGSTETRCRVTPGGGDPRESATESKPPTHACRPSVRVKGCGKSAPRLRRRNWHCKPHREQDRIGMIGWRFGVQPSRFSRFVRVGRGRRPATGVPDEWSSIASTVRGGGGDRTRLTDRLAFFYVVYAVTHGRGNLFIRAACAIAF